MTRNLFNRKNTIVAMAAIALLFLGAVARAWTQDDTSKEGKLSKLYWMTGAWRHDSPRDPLEEHWSESKNGVMIGMCRMGVDPERSLYEIILIEEQEDGVPVMSIRHFGKGLRDRDTKIAAFKLNKFDDKEAVFEDPTNDFPSKITYRVTGTDRLFIRLEGARKGKTISKDFPMERIRS